MEARIVQLPTNEIRVEGDRIVIERFVVRDPTLAAVLAQRDPADRPAVVERALKVGLLAIQDVAATMDVDVVRDEFDKLLRSTEQANQRAADALDQMLRANFADGDGRLPRTLERFLGDRGQLRGFVNELFDETKRDSAIGRMKTLLGTYFDGDASRLALLLDPTRQHSPMHQFRDEVAAGFEKLQERLTAIEAAAAARGAERARSAAKGGDFEDILEALLADVARGGGDLLDRTGGEAGEVLRSKKGDFVVTLNPAQTGGADVRIVVEAKDRGDVAAVDPRRAARGPREPVRGGRARGVQPGPCAERRRPVRRPRRRRLLRDRSGRSGPRRPSRRRCASPGCWPSPASATSGPRWTSRPFAPPSPASVPSSTP